MYNKDVKNLTLLLWSQIVTVCHQNYSWRNNHINQLYNVVFERLTYNLCQSNINECLCICYLPKIARQHVNLGGIMDMGNVFAMYLCWLRQVRWCVYIHRWRKYFRFDEISFLMLFSNMTGILLIGGKNHPECYSFGYVSRCARVYAENFGLYIQLCILHWHRKVSSLRIVFLL